MKELDERKLMLMAIEAMRNSISEPRDDKKVSPKVGAVIIKPDGSIETAHRGELRYGDHAEFTLLERKNRNCDLNGSCLFATLEPCAPGSRKHPKLSCAERIYLARIKKVWIGIEDPDPTVARKGIKYLEDNGVSVKMFDADLQEMITIENEKFLGQAIERAKEVKQKKEPIKLSSFENKVDHYEIKDMSDEALEFYSKKSSNDNLSGTEGFYRSLMLQGLFEEIDRKFIPTGFGIIVFGKSPRFTFPQAALIALIKYPDGSEETKKFEGPAILIPNEFEKWLKNKTPYTMSRDTMERKDDFKLPFDMVRESIINAIVHRDYEIEGAKCQVDISKDEIIIRSPGLPLPQNSIEDFNNFKVSMLSRNPMLHHIFSQMDLAEEKGIGVRSLKEKAEKLNLPLPVYSWNNPYFELKIPLTSESILDSISEITKSELSESEINGLTWLAKNSEISRKDYQKALDIEERAAQNHLGKFMKLNLVQKHGGGPNTKYSFIRSSSE